jgi:DNA-binding transcriptional LysR family regulator
MKGLHRKAHELRKARISNVNLQSMEVFCEVVRLSSFSRGGEVFGVTQSAASQVVAHLEQELEVTLIDRSRRPLAPTPEGRAYYLGCQELLQRHRALADEIHRQQREAAATVRVVSIYSVGLHTLSRYLKDFMAAHDGSRVHLEYLHPMKVYSAVLNEEADIGVISYPKPHRSLKIIDWLEERMVLACPPSHPLAHRRKMRLEDLQGEKFVTFDGDLLIRKEIDRALRSRGVTVAVVSEFDNIETIKQALEINEAVSILPQPSIQREVERGTLAGVRLDAPDLVRPVGIILKRNHQLTSTAGQFMEMLLKTRPRRVS